MDEDIEAVVSDDMSGASNPDNVTEGAESAIVEDTETDESSSDSTIEIVEVEPLNSAGLTQGQTHFFAIGFFILLMFVYFICQRGSYNGRNT